ncbi:MAG: hypothetical protein ACLFN5_05010 [bacterium]
MTKRIAITAPTFWGPPRDKFFEDTDQIYDHPIAIDEQGCLGRFLETADVIEGDYDIVLVSASSSRKWEEEVDQRIQKDIEENRGDFNCYHLTYERFHRLREYIAEKGDDAMLALLSMYGYSEVRNMCMVASHILGYEIAISSDDDVVFDDPDYLKKAREYIGSTAKNGEEIKVVCGPYYTEEGTINYASRPPTWMAYWNNAEAMNEAFDRYIFAEPRLNESSYVVMGNIVLHRDFFTMVPLDPGCHRGEDMDWLINSRIFGFRFYMDSELRVQHQPPPRGFPLWKLVRLDIERFTYDRKKIRQMEKELDIPVEYFDPWPGQFLKEDLEDRIYRTNMMLSNQYLSEGKDEDARGCLDNIFYGKHEYDPGNPLKSIRSFQTDWERLMSFIDDYREELCDLVFSCSPVED